MAWSYPVSPLSPLRPDMFLAVKAPDQKCTVAPTIAGLHCFEMNIPQFSPEYG
jgi:hypothetical protein